MAHLRKPLAVAVGLNSAVLAVETMGTFEADSLSLATDAIHNLSDETGLAFLLLVSLALVAAGLALLVSGTPLFDSGIAIGVAVFIIATTLKAVLGSEEALLWSENVVYGHHDEPMKRA